MVNYLLFSNINRYSHLSPNQYGFTKGKSTTNCIGVLCNQLLHNMNNNNLTGFLFLYHSKAFNCVNHQIIINKLSNTGIHEVNLFEDYPHDHEQCMKLPNATSSFMHIKCWVPQGSVIAKYLLCVKFCYENPWGP